MTAVAGWTVDDHLRDVAPDHVVLYRRFEAIVFECGPVRVSPSKTTITFKGLRRGFAGARPTRHGLRGYLDPTRSAVEDPLIISSSPYTSRLHVNQYRLTCIEELDDTFTDLIREAYQVGQGAHLR
jgi:hypothetical protein